MGFTTGTEMPTIDVVLVTITTKNSGVELGFETSSKIGVEVASNTTDAIQLIVKGKLKAQKKAKTTVTGNNITLTDNVFRYELAKVLQGGKLYYFETEERNSYTEEITSYGIAGYDPPAVGEEEELESFELNAYSAEYNPAGEIVCYERITYPNCTGNPFGVSSEDNVFRVPEYVINSAPNKGQPPYSIRRVFELPEVEGI